MAKGTDGENTSARGGRKTANDWVMAALRVLATNAIADVKVERLADDLGVTKGSFYWHFEGREALLDAMREEWVRFDTEQVIELVDADTGSTDPISAIRTLVRFTLGASGELDGVEAGIREWSASDPKTAAVCSAVDKRRLAYVADYLVAAGIPRPQAERRTDVIYRIVIGEYVWRRYGGDPIDVDAVLEAVDLLCRP